MAKIIRVPTACRVTARALALPHASFVTLKMYNLPGNEVATLVSEKLGAGKHQRMWEAGKLTSGVYQHRLQAGELMRTKKLILLGKSAWPVALFSPEPKITTKVQRQEVNRPFLVS